MRILNLILLAALVIALFGLLDSARRETRLRAELAYSQKQTQTVLDGWNKTTLMLNKTTSMLEETTRNLKGCLGGWVAEGREK